MIVTTVSGTKIDLDALVEAVRSLAAETSDRWYINPNVDPHGPSCLYAHGDEPGCIIGHGAARIGISMNRLRVWDTLGAVAEVLGRGVGDTPESLWLGLVQQFQDDGSTWGEAIVEADAEVKNWSVK